jgi:hypothetical protein
MSSLAMYVGEMPAVGGPGSVGFIARLAGQSPGKLTGQVQFPKIEPAVATL